MSKKTWVSIKRGLITDPKHREEMAECVWLFLYMIDNVSWETGIIEDWHDQTAADDMRLECRALRRLRQKLGNLEYITCEQKQHGQRITIHLWVNPRNYSGAVLNPRGAAVAKRLPSIQAQGSHERPPSDPQGSNQTATPTSSSNKIANTITYSASLTRPDSNPPVDDSMQSPNGGSSKTSRPTDDRLQPASTREIQDAYLRVSGYGAGEVSWAAGNAAAAKWLAERCTAVELEIMYSTLKGQPFWREKMLTLANIRKQYPEAIHQARNGSSGATKIERSIARFLAKQENQPNQGDGSNG